MKKRQPKKIPTILGLIILITGGFLGIFLANRSQTFLLKASGETTPQQIKITNITDSSFTVSWITLAAAKGFISFGEKSQLGQTFLDERDEGTGNVQEYFAHYVSLKNLKPGIKYFFKINSAEKSFGNGDRPYEITSAQIINLPLPESDIAYGMILEPSGNPAKGAIVYLSLANTTPLSSLVKNDGSWMINLSTARSVNLNSYSSYNKEIQVEEIFVQGEKSDTAVAITTTKNDSPLPTLTLGQTYDLRQAIVSSSPTPTIFSPLSSYITSPPEIPSAITTASPTPLAPTPTQVSRGFSLQPIISPPSGQKITIINPSEGENINNQKPEFIGTGPKDEALQIIVQSEVNYSGQMLVAEDGTWKWTPPADLPPGQHTVTIVYEDKTGITQKVVRNFTVLATGESDLPSFSSSPSGQLTTIPSTPTPTTSSRAALPPSGPPPPRSGNLTLTFFSLIIGIALLILGFYQYKSS